MPEAIAAALADLRQPDLSGLPRDEVARATREMFGPAGLRPEWLAWLRRRISELSGGQTSLSDADRADFPWASKQWGAVYQRLTRHGEQQLLIIGDSTPPFLFVPPPSG